jgi:ABC-type amino acid transport substrate-binding protein
MPVMYFLGHYAREHASLTVISPVGHLMDPDPAGIAFGKKDKTLQAAVVEVLKAMREDGSFPRLLEEWFSP